MRAIDVSGVHFAYEDGTEALQGIDFHVEQGEFVAVLGSNGSGKTTLLGLLVGLLKTKTGQIRIGEREIGSLSAEELYQRVGLVFQNPNDQLFAATVEEDVAFGPRNLELPEEEVKRRVTEALSAVQALPLGGRAIHHLSFGEQKRVSLAGILAMRPRVLILDEPTAGLDPAGEAQMMQLLKRLNREEGMTIILATHSVDMLPLFASRIYVLDGGRVLREGPAEEIFCHQEMIVRAKLRIPYVSRLMYEMKRHDGVPIDGLPLTIGEARAQLLELIPKEMILEPSGEFKP
jgi:cobalt/nickel transport system ATP-binding protein